MTGRMTIGLSYTAFYLVNVYCISFGLKFDRVIGAISTYKLKLYVTTRVSSAINLLAIRGVSLLQAAFCQCRACLISCCPYHDL